MGYFEQTEPFLDAIHDAPTVSYELLDRAEAPTEAYECVVAHKVAAPAEAKPASRWERLKSLGNHVLENLGVNHISGAHLH